MPFTAIINNLVAALLFKTGEKAWSAFKNPLENAICLTSIHFYKEKGVEIDTNKFRSIFNGGVGREEIEKFVNGQDFIDDGRLALHFAQLEEPYFYDTSVKLKKYAEIMYFFKKSFIEELLKNPETSASTLSSLHHIYHKDNQLDHQETLGQIQILQKELEELKRVISRHSILTSKEHKYVLEEPIQNEKDSPANVQTHEYPSSLVERYCLEYGYGEMCKRILFCIGKAFSIGRSNYTTNKEVDVTLRVLPCDTFSQHPEEWKKNRIISGIHFSIRYHKEMFEIKANNKSSNAVFIIPNEQNRSRRISCQVGVRWEKMPKESRVSIGETDVLPLSCRILAGINSVNDILHIKRLDNAQHIEYILSPQKVIPCIIDGGQIRISATDSTFYVIFGEQNTISLTIGDRVPYGIDKVKHKNFIVPYNFSFEGINVCIRKAVIEDFKRI